jgi:hypothetical protein
MTGLDHEHTAAIDVAAEWLALTPHERLDRPIVPTLRSRFDLSVDQAIAAIREAKKLRRRTDGGS